MLSDKHFEKQEHKLNFENKTKTRRLTDIRRGQQYMRKIDSLAENQWLANVPRQSDGGNRYVRVRPITETTYSKLHSERLMREHAGLGTGESRPLQRVQSERYPPSARRQSYADEVLLAGRFTSTDVPSPGRRSKIFLEKLSPSPDSRHGVLQPIVHNDKHIFNQYGSRLSHLDSKTELRKEDVEQKYEPFRFRESMRRVIKPVPKKSVPMSRVAEDDKNRQRRISTDFRSTRNGTVRVIQPPDPLPEAKRSAVDIVFGGEGIKNEQTFILLRHVDFLLNPDRKEKFSSLGSSEKDFPPSKSPCVSDFSDAPSDFLQIKDQARGPQKEMHFPQNEKENNTQVPIYPMYHENLHLTRTKKKVATLQSTLNELGARPMDVMRKCRIWVNSIPDISDDQEEVKMEETGKKRIVVYV